jgi:Holliday junction DNA helicase RuvA
VIASLRGTVLAATPAHLIVEVGGVGYQVFTTPETASEASKAGECFLFTSMIVREDAMILFGFTEAEEQKLFDLLRSVTGVGPKSALAILANLGVEQIRIAVSAEDDAAFRAVSGIGPKTAKLITVTLAGKITSEVLSPTKNSSHGVQVGNLIEALIGLGWPERAAAEAVRESLAHLGSSAPQNELLRFALNRLGAGKSTSGPEA